MSRGSSGDAQEVPRPARSTSFAMGGPALVQLFDELDWSASALGPRDDWPASLETSFSILLDSKFPMFVAWGDDLIFLYNDAYAELLGDKHPSALGGRFEHIWSEIWDDIGPLVARAMSGEASWIEDHHLNVFRRGYLEEAWFTFSYSPVRDDTGRVAGMFCAVTETTGRVLAERALVNLNETLEARVDERSRLLRQAEDELRRNQKYEAIAQLTGGVAHDFNNLLTVIRGSVDLLRQEDLSREKQRRYLDAVASTADRAAQLTAQLLAFAGRQTLSPEAFDARHALTDIVDIVRHVTGPGIAFDVRLSELDCCVKADRGQFEAALTNLILNGRDAVDGQGRLTLSVERGVASSSPLVCDGDCIAVRVTDSGVGIAAENLDRIFEPFFTTKSVDAGTGLGLSQAIGFARQSGGDIRVESVVGSGTTFTLYLPRVHSLDEVHVATISVERVVDIAGRRILVVEDNAAVGAFAVHALEDLGFATMLTSDADAALAALASDPDRFDVLFSDVVMPGLSGLELARQVRMLYPRIAIVLASGYSDALAQGGSQGFALLRKPYSIEELSTSIMREVRADMPEAADLEIGVPPLPLDAAPPRIDR